MAELKKASPQEIRAFFSDGTREVTTRELMDLKKADDDGTSYNQVAYGIGDGSLNY